jgi:hypothetical protein
MCSNRGGCVSLDTCACDTGYGGPECEYITCQNITQVAPNVCSGHGTCDNIDTCNCTDGYSGDDCSEYSCFTKDSQSASVCSGHGACTAPDTCQCEAKYTKDDCSVPQCYNVDADEGTVCSGHGTCQGPDSCKCNRGFTGSECQLPVCYGFNASDHNSCYGNGECVDYNDCKCAPGFSGPECNFPICNNIVSNDTNCNCTDSSCESYECYAIDGFGDLCSGIGTCTGNDSCTCEDSYSGNHCQSAPCDGIAADDPTVCSGNGQCPTGNCACYGGYTGSNCSEQVIASPSPVYSSIQEAASSELEASVANSASAILSSFVQPSGQVGESSIVTTSVLPSGSDQQPVNSIMTSASDFPSESSAHVEVSQSQQPQTSSPAVVASSETPAVLTASINIQIQQNSTVTLTGSSFQAASPNAGSPANLVYTISNVQHGMFVRLNNKGVAITTFTQQDVNSGLIGFTQDGTTTKPSFTVQVTDGMNTITVTSFTITLLLKPQVVQTKKITAKANQAVTVTKDNLSTTDTTTPVTNIVYTVQSIEHGQFELKSNPGVAVTTFTQAQIDNGQVVFRHDNTNEDSNFILVVTNGLLSADGQMNVPASKTSNNNRNGKIIGGVLGGFFGLLLILLIILIIVIVAVFVLRVKKGGNKETVHEMELANI